MRHQLRKPGIRHGVIDAWSKSAVEVQYSVIMIDYFTGKTAIQQNEADACIIIKALVIMADISVLSGFCICQVSCFYNNIFQTNFSWLITEDGAFDFWVPSHLPLKYLFLEEKYWLFTKTHGCKKQHLSNP